MGRVAGGSDPDCVVARLVGAHEYPPFQARFTFVLGATYRPSDNRNPGIWTIFMPTEVRFVTSNQHKIAEAEAILGPQGITVLPSNLKVEELQTTETDRLVRDKLLKAYAAIGRPLFVEHTGLYVDRIQGLPGGLTQIFWDTLQADRFARLLGGDSTAISRAVARTSIAYCDGRQIYQFSGDIVGAIVNVPRGSRDFQWDCIFQPDNSAETFAEMGSEKKNEVSMRRLALDALAEHIVKSHKP